MSNKINILHDSELDALIADLDLVSILDATFAGLYTGQVVQPAQTLTLFPDQRGDFITYLGVLGQDDVFGAKLSPYISGDKPKVTAWTVLMSMQTGLPLLLCDAGRLTALRTGATTALAVDKLARSDSRVLALFGSGLVAQAHLKYAATLRNWSEIRVFSPGLTENPERQAKLAALDARVSVSPDAATCVKQADVVMLATSSGTPVVDFADLAAKALVTSISTNLPQAHEIDPARLAELDVYCDYKATTPASAGEMVLAAASGLWSPGAIKGDLADLCAGVAPLPDYSRPVFFRSIGLGIEDVAIANAIYKKMNG